MRLGYKKLGKTFLNNRILWLAAVFFVLFLLLGELLVLVPYLALLVAQGLGAIGEKMMFVTENYLVSFVPQLLVFLLFALLTKKNRFLFERCLPARRSGCEGMFRLKGNRISMLLLGLLAGFAMNFACIAAALLHGDIHLELSFSVRDVPLFLFAFLAVLIQSTTEEVWCRGFLYERIHVHYPLWLAILLFLAWGALMYLLWLWIDRRK